MLENGCANIGLKPVYAHLLYLLLSIPNKITSNESHGTCSFENRPKYGAGTSYSPYFGVPGAREGNLYIERAPGTREI